MKKKVETSGYSQTPLARKLGLKSGQNILLINKPRYYFDLFSDFPEEVSILKSGKEEEVDFIHLFVKSVEEFEDRVIHVKPLLKKDGLLWVSWPKGASKIKTDLKRDFIREFMLDIGLVDVKVCSVDQDWSGLKFVYRLKDR
ncbi:MAG: DUF3052 domain-containing protein [Bacteroidota bacterium]